MEFDVQKIEELKKVLEATYDGHCKIDKILTEILEKNYENEESFKEIIELLNSTNEAFRSYSDARSKLHTYLMK